MPRQARACGQALVVEATNQMRAARIVPNVAEDGAAQRAPACEAQLLGGIQAAGPPRRVVDLLRAIDWKKVKWCGGSEKHVDRVEEYRV